MKFVWDPNKAAANHAKAWFAFDEASTVFVEGLALSGADPGNSDGEARFVTLVYLLGGACISNMTPGSFVDAFAFSVQTLATIGYGVMAPITI